jgi:hypothetical protein
MSFKFEYYYFRVFIYIIIPFDLVLIWREFPLIRQLFFLPALSFSSFGLSSFCPELISSFLTELLLLLRFEGNEEQQCYAEATLLFLVGLVKLTKLHLLELE